MKIEIEKRLKIDTSLHGLLTISWLYLHGREQFYLKECYKIIQWIKA